MRLQTIATTAGLFVCVSLAWELMSARAELRTLADENRRVSDAIAETTEKSARLLSEAEERALEISARRQVVLATMTAEQRARSVVGPLIARIKADHAIKPPPPSPMPPPSPPMAQYFLELMSDPKYNAAVKQMERGHAWMFYEGKLREAGLSADEMNRVLDLLAEREMVRWDYNSLAKDQADLNEFPSQIQSRRTEILDEIRREIGDRKFAKITEDVPQRHVTVGPAGRTEWTTKSRDVVPHPLGVRPEFSALERRLSYSAEPLSKPQMSELAGLAERVGFTRGSLLLDATFVERTRSILSAGQQTGLDELKVEAEAFKARSQLPTSAVTPQAASSSRK